MIDRSSIGLLCSPRYLLYICHLHHYITNEEPVYWRKPEYKTQLLGVWEDIQRDRTESLQSFLPDFRVG